MSISAETNQKQLQSADRLQGEVHGVARRMADAGNGAAQKLREEFGLLLAAHGVDGDHRFASW